MMLTVGTFARSRAIESWTSHDVQDPQSPVEATAASKPERISSIWSSGMP